MARSRMHASRAMLAISPLPRSRPRVASSTVPSAIRSSSVVPDPIFVAATAGTLVITQEGETDSPKIQVQIPDNGRRGPFALDLSKVHAPLQPGITYRATMGDRHIVFRVAQGAGGDTVAALQRIVPI